MFKYNFLSNNKYNKLTIRKKILIIKVASWYVLLDKCVYNDKIYIIILNRFLKSKPN